MALVNVHDNNELLDILRGKFDTNEELLFVDNFYLYLNKDRNSDFVIDFDDVYQLIGFTRKDNAKRLLTTKLTENVHFMVEKAAPPIGGAAFIGGSGLNKERITLTVTGFKKFCMRADTKRADEIHDYYIKMEDAVFEYTSNQMKASKALNAQNTMLIENKMEKSLFDAYSGKKVVYVGRVSDHVIKFGYSDNLYERIHRHKKDISDAFKVVFVVECELNRELEQLFKDDSQVQERRFSEVFGDRKQTELVRLDTDFGIEHVEKLLKRLKTKLENSMELARLDKTLEIEKEKTRQLELQVKLNEQQIKILNDTNKFKECITNIYSTNLKETFDDMYRYLIANNQLESVAVHSDAEFDKNDANFKIFLKRHIVHTGKKSDMVALKTLYDAYLPNLASSPRRKGAVKIAITEFMTAAFPHVPIEYKRGTYMNQRDCGWFGFRYT